MEEEWRDIPGYIGYQVSSLGNVRSFRIKGTGNMAKVSTSPHLLAILTHRNGYKFINLCTENGGKEHKSIHGLVMLTFVGPRPEGMVVAHNNGTPSDNRLENLRYATFSENEADKVRHGTATIRRLSVADVKYIKTHCKYYSHTCGYRALARKFGLTKVAISRIMDGITYKEIKI